MTGAKIKSAPNELHSFVKKESIVLKTDLTQGETAKSLLVFAFPMILGNILQQAYNISDTLIIGRFLGEDALAAVGSTYTLTTFIYSIITGLCMGSGALVSYFRGKNDKDRQCACITDSFFIVGTVSAAALIVTLCFLDGIIGLLNTPQGIFSLTKDYAEIIFPGIIFIFLYNYYAYMLRAFGNSSVPLIFLGSASVVNVVLDIVFTVYLKLGVKGAAYATLIAQAASGIGLAVYAVITEHEMRLRYKKGCFFETLRMSLSASVQQSVMNFGILMIQGLVNSFGTAVMAAFTIAVKIDTLAYMPAQEFGNAFSLFISQNYGAQKYDRIKNSCKTAFLISVSFCAIVSAAVYVFAKELMEIFVGTDGTGIVAQGVSYLRTEGAFYVGIGVLFLLYGYFRGINKPEISLVLTVISLGTRVALAYFLSSFDAAGVYGIWVSIPIGWFLADAAGFLLLKVRSHNTQRN